MDRLVNIFGIGLLAALIGFAATSDWESVLGISLGGFWVFLAGLLVYRRERHQVDSRWWSRMLLAGLLVRVLAAFLHLAVALWFHPGVSVDFLGYHGSGNDMAKQILGGEWKFIDPYTRKREFRLIEHLWGLSNFLVGPGLVGMVLLAAVVGFIGCYLFLLSFRTEFSSRKETRFFALALFFLPSAAFWGGYPGKDTWVLFSLGWMAYSYACLLQKFKLRYVFAILLSLCSLVFIRWPVGGVAAFALGVSWLLKAGKGPAAILRPVRVAVCPFVLVFILSSMGSFVGGSAIDFIANLGPSLDTLAENAALIHKGYTQGGSGRALEITDSSVRGVLRYLPQGAFAFLFRPMIFEAHYSLAVFAALEATFFLVLTLWRWRSLVAAIRLAFTNPFIGFCAVAFIGLTAILAVEANFGTIVRHRAMVLPFLLILMSVPFNRKGGGGVL